MASRRLLLRAVDSLLREEDEGLFFSVLDGCGAMRCARRARERAARVSAVAARCSAATERVLRATAGQPELRALREARAAQEANVAAKAAALAKAEAENARAGEALARLKQRVAAEAGGRGAHEREQAERVAREESRLQLVGRVRVRGLRDAVWR
jgi:hypothetical protein